MYVLAALVLLAVGLWALRGQRSNIRRNGKRLPFVRPHTSLQSLTYHQPSAWYVAVSW